MAKAKSQISLRSHRESLKLTLEQAALLAHVSPRTWHYWEQAGNAPSVNKYPDIAAALCITLTQVQDAVRLIEIEMLKRGVA